MTRPLPEHEGRPPVAKPATSPLAVDLPAARFERLRDILASYSGVFLDASRQRMLESAVARRLSATGDTLDSYERRLASNDREELRRLSEQVLNHETFFFRNKPHMRALQEVLLPELHRRKPVGEPIRIWSAGCSTGEEAYSLAIIALDVCRRLGRRVEVWGTDLSQPALEQARAGRYSGRSLVNVSPDLLSRYFQACPEGYAVSEAVRQAVRFDQVNLLEPLPAAASGVDMIFCQNVMIYFHVETSRVILERMYACLPDGGLLFLGFSETLWNVFDRFRSREVLGAFVYYKEAPQKPSPATSPSPAREAPAPAAAKRATPAVERQPPVRRPPEHGEAQLLERGRSLLAAGAGEAAVDLLRRIPPGSAQAPDAIALLAQDHADRGELELALAEAQRAIEIEPMNEAAYVLRGVIYGRQGLWQEAAGQLERARYLNGESGLISFRLAEAYRHLQRQAAAVREYRSALRKLEGHPPDELLDGVAVDWLRETCRRQVARLDSHAL